MNLYVGFALIIIAMGAWLYAFFTQNIDAMMDACFLYVLGKIHCIEYDIEELANEIKRTT